MTHISNPSLLILARESRGMSQKDLANALGVSTGKVCRVEQGDQSFNSEVGQDVTKILDYPEHFFTQEAEAFLPTSIDFRKRLKVPQKTLAPIIAQINLYRINVEELNRRMGMEKSQLPKLTKRELSDPVKAAKAIRKLWNVPSGPIVNVTELIESQNIPVVSFDFGTERVDSRTMITKDGYPILFTNKSMLGDRLRFSLAYELGHIILHNGTAESSLDPDHEANQFAAELLMPEHDIKPDLKKQITLSLLGELKRKWGVSMQALLYRASDLNLISYNQKRYLLGQFNAMSIRRREPQEFDVPIEKPKLLRSMITEYRTKTRLSLKEMADAFHLTHQEFMKKYAD